MKIKSQKDFFSGLLFLIVGVMFALGAAHHPLGSSERPGSGYFPLLLSGTMVLLGVVVLFTSLTIETEGGDLIGAIAWRPVLGVVGSVAIFGAILPLLGLFVTVPLLVVGIGLAVGRVAWKGLLVHAALLTCAAWAVFIWGLGLGMPLKPFFVRG